MSPREIRFPERRVLLARSSVNQWTQFDNLFDILAELRLAKRLAGEFVELPPRDQAASIEESLTRIQPPPYAAPAVCLLDTGVNRGHPLLALALAEEHVLTSDPNWSPADLCGHGTEMAGIALYGCLTTLFGDNTPVMLRHRLQSVKILPDHRQNEPELYGAITSQAISRAEIASPGRNRVFCLAVTADGGDEGFPSSWSAALDSIGAGVESGYRTLICVSAGNTPLDGRQHFPAHNHVHGVEDPAQVWNALTVGAYTERAVILSESYGGWQPIAQPGQLSPSSRTSVVWSNKTWPLNQILSWKVAIMPLTQRRGRPITWRTLPIDHARGSDRSLG